MLERQCFMPIKKLIIKFTKYLMIFAMRNKQIAQGIKKDLKKTAMYIIMKIYILMIGYQLSQL